MDDLIEKLAADARPVAPLASPWRRALTTLGVVAAGGLAAIALLETSVLPARHGGGERTWLLIEMTVLLAAGLIAVIGAFFSAVPGRSRFWGFAPLPFFVAWLVMSGAAVAANGMPWQIGQSWHCLLFIGGGGIGIGLPLIRLLSRARPIHPARVALLAGLGSAALSAFLLHFFHPFRTSPADLAVHAGGVLLVVALAALLRGRALRPA